jgi:hypothetical protein
MGWPHYQRPAGSRKIPDSRELYRRSVANQTWPCPTVTYSRGVPFGDDPEFASDPGLKYLPASFVSDWIPRP